MTFMIQDDSVALAGPKFLFNILIFSPTFSWYMDTTSRKSYKSYAMTACCGDQASSPWSVLMHVARRGPWKWCARKWKWSKTVCDFPAYAPWTINWTIYNSIRLHCLSLETAVSLRDVAQQQSSRLYHSTRWYHLVSCWLKCKFCAVRLMVVACVFTLTQYVAQWWRRLPTKQNVVTSNCSIAKLSLLELALELGF